MKKLDVIFTELLKLPKISSYTTWRVPSIWINSKQVLTRYGERHNVTMGLLNVLHCY